jgi:hypothetical protein
MSRLLWLVDRDDGGFIGLSDDELEEKVESDPRLDADAVLAAMYAPGQWPNSPAIERKAA